jgi:hypothetical protein
MRELAVCDCGPHEACSACPETTPHEPITQYFDYGHLPPRLQEISRPVGKVAYKMLRALPPSPERSAGLRKLLEAKDCFVRASLDKEHA